MSRPILIKVTTDWAKKATVNAQQILYYQEALDPTNGPTMIVFANYSLIVKETVAELDDIIGRALFERGV